MASIHGLNGFQIGSRDGIRDQERFCPHHWTSNHDISECRALANDTARSGYPGIQIKGGRKRNASGLTSPIMQKRDRPMEYQFKSLSPTSQDHDHPAGRDSSFNHGRISVRPLSNGTQKFCDYCDKPNHTSDECWQRKKQLKDQGQFRKQYMKSGSSGPLHCLLCDGTTHTTDQCPKNYHASRSYCATCLFSFPAPGEPFSLAQQETHEKRCEARKRKILKSYEEHEDWAAHGITPAQMTYLDGMIPVCELCSEGRHGVTGWWWDADGDAIMWGIGLDLPLNDRPFIIEEEEWILDREISRVIIPCSCTSSDKKHMKKFVPWYKLWR